MDYPDYIDQEMREILDALAPAVVPRSQRRAAVRTDRHAPYYSPRRYRRI